MLRNLLPPDPLNVFQKYWQGSKNLWRKRLLILVIALIVFLGLVHAGVRYIVWPRIEKSKPAIEQLLSKRLGTNVSIDSLQVSWDGLRPQFSMEGLRFNGDNKASAPLQIKKIHGELSLISFYYLEPYFHKLEVEDAQIQIKRSADGTIRIAGILIKNDSDDFSTGNWLLAQNDIQITNTQIHLQDFQGKALNTDIELTEFHLTNGIRKHDALIQAKTPWSNGPLDLNAHFVHRLGGQAGNWRDWAGEFAWNFSGLEFQKVTQDFDIPLHLLSGNISSKGHMSLDSGRPDGGQMSFIADQFRLQLSKEDAAIEFGRLETELTQESDGKFLSVTAQNFAWRDITKPSNAPLEFLSPMTFRWRPPEQGGEIKEFGFSSPKILVKDVTRFALNLPLSKKVHRWIEIAKADGELQDLDIHWSEKQSALASLPIPGSWFNFDKLDFSINARMVDLSFTGIDKDIPSVSHLTGQIAGDQKQGVLTLNSPNLIVEVDNFLLDPIIKLDQAQGQIRWNKQSGGWLISSKGLAIENADLTAKVDVAYLMTEAKQPDDLKLDIDFQQANLIQAYRYLPMTMSADTKLYLSKAFAAGKVINGSLHIKGDPNNAPFPPGTAGEFALNFPISGTTFKPAPLISVDQGVWGDFTNVAGTISMKQSALNVDISQANHQEVSLSNINAQIPNVSAKQLVLAVNGNAQGQAPQMLSYLFSSPFGKKRPELEKNLKVSGPLDLNLKLQVPLNNSDDTKIDAHLNLINNTAQWASIPPLEALKGKVRITETNPEFEDVSAQFLGGSIRMASAPPSIDKQNFTITGDLSADFLRKYFSEVSESVTTLLNGMSGSAKYNGLISFSKAGSETKLKFDLSNWASNAPVPLKKQSGSPLEGELLFQSFAKKTNSDRLNWSGSLGNQYFTQGALNSNNELRYAIGVGSPATMPAKGLNIGIQANELNFDTWRNFLLSNQVRAPASKNVAVSTTGIQVNAQIKSLTAADYVWPNFNLSALLKNNDWQLNVTSPKMTGQVVYSEPSISQPSGMIAGRLALLKFSDDQNPKASSSSKKTGATNSKLSPNAIPTLDLIVDNFSWERAQLGVVKIKSQTTKNLLNIEKLQVINPQDNATITGQWSLDPQTGKQKTSLVQDLQIKDAGQIIAHWTPTKSIEGGQGQLIGNLEWMSSPFTPDFQTLNGQLNLKLEKGRLLEVNSSAAQILNVLSLQSLFKFATLDLQGSVGNLVTKGTAYNSITGSFNIQNGIAKTDQFVMILDQARVAMNGQIDVPKQTQDLRVTIFPTIDATAGSLALFAINPIVGLSALVGQYLVTNQINRSMQSDYLIQGSWVDPEVIPLNQQGQPLDKNTLDTIRKKGLLKEQSKPSSSGNAAPAIASPSD